MLKFHIGDKVVVQKSCPPYKDYEQWVLSKDHEHGHTYIVDHVTDSSSAGEDICYDTDSNWYYRSSDLKLFNNFNDLPLFKEIVNE